jgi:predicted O-linked N-acetylglucosamine transferase (SPINDLY family)
MATARLVLKNAALCEDKTREKLRQAFVDKGVEPGRLELLGSDASQRTHLERYWHIDIGLDTFPYNGTTTTCEALWMGVPVITLAGNTHASRVGVSQLSNLGLVELIAYAPDEYVSTALRLASDMCHLKNLRSDLRSRMVDSPLTNGQHLTRIVEKIFHEISLQHG